MARRSRLPVMSDEARDFAVEIAALESTMKSDEERSVYGMRRRYESWACALLVTHLYSSIFPFCAGQLVEFAVCQRRRSGGEPIWLRLYRLNLTCEALLLLRYLCIYP